MGFFQTLSAIITTKIQPEIDLSSNYKAYYSIDDYRRCYECENAQGKLWELDAPVEPWYQPKLHAFCRCFIARALTVKASTATANGFNGADWFLKYLGRLPEYYISKELARLLGWKEGKSPSYFCPGKMFACGEYKNDDGHLPAAPGRSWQEADINYTNGKRNGQRIVWSNDGLVFVSYDHYETFIEVI